MDQSQILDGSSASSLPVRNGAGVPPSASRGSATALAPAPYPIASILHPVELQAAFSATESLSEMASRDLDAALQLLAERAQYITDASGAAIALRRGRHNDMFCRASAGSSAPELGALLSMEYGLSGESVRTREIQRCDDAQNDARVNREGCRRLGIASVIVLPIISQDHVLGVFELFSGKPYAFDERDLSALQRLGAMVELTLKFAVPEQSLLPLPEFSQQAQANKPAAVIETNPQATATSEKGCPTFASVANVGITEPAIQKTQPRENPPQLQPATPPAKTVEPVAKKALFWSAATADRNNAPPTQPGPAVPIPPVMRNLQKCQACGFPISQGRKLCIECEEKEWRGQPSR
jgi:GAF domain